MTWSLSARRRLLLFALHQVAYPSGKVMVPALSRMTDAPDRYPGAYLRVAPCYWLRCLAGAVALAYAAYECLRTPLLWLYVVTSGLAKAHHILRAGLRFVLEPHGSAVTLWLIKMQLTGGLIVVLGTATILSYQIVSCIALTFASGREALGKARDLTAKMLFRKTPESKA